MGWVTVNKLMKDPKYCKKNIYPCVKPAPPNYSSHHANRRKQFYYRQIKRFLRSLPNKKPKKMPQLTSIYLYNRKNIRDFPKNSWFRNTALAEISQKILDISQKIRELDTLCDSSSEITLDKFEFDTLCEFVQEKSANELDQYLQSVKDKITKDIALQLFFLALCTHTIRDFKTKINESPLDTIAVMRKWNILHLNDENIRMTGRDLLYSFECKETRVGQEMVSEVIDYLLLLNEVPSIQFFDSRNVEFKFYDAQDDDHTISDSIASLNELRMEKKREMVSLLERNTHILTAVVNIIAEYCLAPYIFHYNETDYSIQMVNYGDYKQS